VNIYNQQKEIAPHGRIGVSHFARNNRVESNNLFAA
jgi:hypothetical protein